MQAMKLPVKKFLQLCVPYRAALLLARLGRFYIRRAPFQFAKHSIVECRSIFRVCNWHKLRTIAATELGTLYEIQFPDMIQRYIFYFGVWEPAITAFVRGSLSAGDKFIDIGANVGYYTCLAAKLVGPSGHVYALEASPRIYGNLLQNIKLNQITNFTSYNLAVFDKKTRLNVFKETEWNVGRTSVIQSEVEREKETEVDALPLNEIIDRRVLHTARLIKIDVEGAEWFVINGLKEELAYFNFETEWLIEIGPSAAYKTTRTSELVGLFKKAGYKMYMIENDYTVAWYLKQGHRYLAQRAEDVVNTAPTEITSQIDVLFTKQSY
jgi:FkbM family methyltransferase